MSSYLLETEAEELTTEYDELYRKFRRPVSIYSQASEIVNKHSRASLPGYLEHADWHDLEGLLSEVVKRLPPLFFYIDAIDDEYAHAPLYWLRCQKGLFYTVMKLAKDELFGARLHVIICVRDHVLSSVFRSEHSTRYRDSPYIRTLVWDETSLRFFIEEKLRALPDAWFADPSRRDDDPLSAWLGFSEIHNVRRGVREGVVQYMLRHTRLSPRDSVQLGNRITSRIAAASKGQHVWGEDAFRELISTIASEWGDEQLTICAQQMSADIMPAHAADQDYAEVFTGALAYAPAISDALRRFIVEEVGADRFDRDLFDTARESALDRFDERTDAFEVLWQNGLLGVGYGDMDAGREVFYRVGHQADQFLIPESADYFVLHSSMIDALRIDAVGDHQVLGFRAR